MSACFVIQLTRVDCEPCFRDPRQGFSIIHVSQIVQNSAVQKYVLSRIFLIRATLNVNLTTWKDINFHIELRLIGVTDTFDGTILCGTIFSRNFHVIITLLFEHP